MMFSLTKLSLIPLCASLFGQVALSHPVVDATLDLTSSSDNDTLLLEDRSLEERQSGGSLAITGVPGATHPRLEVRQMLFDKPNQWTLLIMGLQRFQQMSQSDRAGYYQIAGIHGVPRVNWDGVGRCSNCQSADGYCTHDSILFPAWHRAYLALFEQQFMTVVNQVAREFPAWRVPWMTGAASTMRWPYWDWAARPRPGYNTLPTVVSQKFVTIDGPNGKLTIINPLFRHDFRDPSQLVYSPFVNWKVTLRYPDSNANSASSQQQASIAAFDSIRASLQDQVYQLMTTCDDYPHFSNDRADSSSTRCSNSLEGIHNTIHVNGGGPGSQGVSAGHMTYLATAAFDPMFWLHHANVDRLFALWQAIHPNAYSGSQVAGASTWTIAQGSRQDMNSPLQPFHRDTNGNFWTSNGVRDTRTFRYTYPEFSNSDGSASAIRGYVNRLYGPSATLTAGAVKRTAIPEPVDVLNKTEDAASDLVEQAKNVTSEFLNGTYNATTGLTNATTSIAEEAEKDIVESDLISPIMAGNGSLFQYVANLKTPRYALNGSYNVFIFLGEPETEDPTAWATDPNVAGSYGVLAQPNMQHMNVVVAGSVPLTRSLTQRVEDGLLGTLSQALATPFLEKTLKWRIAGPMGGIDAAQVPDFKMSVVCSTASVPESENELPEYSDFLELPEITDGKPGGLCKDEVADKENNEYTDVAVDPVRIGKLI